MSDTKYLVLALSNESAELWKNTDEIALGLKKMYKKDNEFKKSLDDFLTDFNQNNEEKITIIDLVDLKFDRKMPFEKVKLIKQFLEETLNKFNIGFSFKSGTFVWIEGCIADVKNSVMNFTWLVNNAEAFLNFVKVIRDLLVELKDKVDAILNNMKFREVLYFLFSNLCQKWQKEVLKKVCENIKWKEKYKKFVYKKNWWEKSDTSILTNFIVWDNQKLKIKLTQHLSLIHSGKNKTQKLKKEFLDLFINHLIKDKALLDWVVDNGTWDLSIDIQDEFEWKRWKLKKEKETNNELWAKNVISDDDDSFDWEWDWTIWYWDQSEKLSPVNHTLNNVENIRLWDYLNWLKASEQREILIKLYKEAGKIDNLKVIMWKWKIFSSQLTNLFKNGLDLSEKNRKRLTMNLYFLLDNWKDWKLQEETIDFIIRFLSKNEILSNTIGIVVEKIKDNKEGKVRSIDWNNNLVLEWQTREEIPRTAFDKMWKTIKPIPWQRWEVITTYSSIALKTKSSTSLKLSDFLVVINEIIREKIIKNYPKIKSENYKDFEVLEWHFTMVLNWTDWCITLDMFSNLQEWIKNCGRWKNITKIISLEDLDSELSIYIMKNRIKI